MSRNARLALLAASVPIALVLLLVAVVGIDRASSSGEVLRGVSVNGVSLSGQDETEALATVSAIEADLAATPALFTVNGRQFELIPAEIGFDIDERSVVSEAMTIGRTGGLLAQVGNWIGRFGAEDDLEAPISIDRTLLEGVLDGWEQRAIDEPYFDGSVEIEGTQAVARYPSPGLAIDPIEAYDLVLASVSSTVRPAVELPVAVVEPRLTAADIEAAVDEANLVLAGPVTLDLASPEIRFTVTPAQLAAVLRVEVDPDAAERVRLYFDEEAVVALVEPLRSEFEFPPVDAEFRFNDDGTVSVLPGRSGTVVDDEQLVERLWRAAHRPARVGEFPLAEGVEPDFTTAEAQAMMPITRVSDFTTNHRCCEPRVTNIHIFADIVNGTIVQPGEILSLNELVGRRDRERGFVPAPMISSGELVDSVGGGVSQFATTFYNAVFFGGYEDIEHSPHSLYISRYPEGREATISWPAPDLKFRNDSDAVIIVRTRYTDTSITVEFWGNNGGREVTASKSERFNFTDPEVEYEADNSIVPGSEVVVSSGTRGFSVTVVRRISYQDGTPDSEERWTVRYRSQPRIVRVHSCNIPAGEPGHTGNPCPAPVPSVIGQRSQDARGVIEGAGFRFTRGDPIPVDDPDQNNLIVAQSPAAGTYAPAGSIVIVQLGQYTPPTTTTSTTTTTVPASTTTTTEPPPDE